MFKRYLVVLGALVIPILLAVASQVLSAPVPPAGLSPEPIVLAVTGTAPAADPGAEGSTREVLQAPQAGTPSGHVPEPTASSGAATSLTTWGSVGASTGPASAGSGGGAPAEQADEPDVNDEGADCDEH